VTTAKEGGRLKDAGRGGEPKHHRWEESANKNEKRRESETKGEREKKDPVKKGERIKGKKKKTP